MQELEKILEEMRGIKDGNRKEKLYAKYPPNGKDQEVLNAYSQGYEDGTDNFYNAVVDIIRKHMTNDPAGKAPKVENILDKIEAEHPYKVPGDRDTYDKYNEGWSDAIDRVRGALQVMNSEPFEFDFSSVKSFKCRCGQKYINTGRTERSEK